jgi:hypothetical protein
MGNEVYSGVIAIALGAVAGDGGLRLLLDLLPEPWSLLQWVFAVASLVLVFTTDAGRGLPGLLSGQRLADARRDAAGPARGQRLEAK